MSELQNIMMTCQNIIEDRTISTSEYNSESAKCAETSDDTAHKRLRLGLFPLVLETLFVNYTLVSCYETHGENNAVSNFITLRTL